MPYYPDARLISKLTTIQREALLPEEAFGVVQASEGQDVDIRQVVARGALPSRHIIVEVRPILGNVDDATLNKLLLVKDRAMAQAGSPIAGRDPKRGKRVLAPVDGLVVYAGDGRIVMQEKPAVITVEAGVRGTVTQVYPGRGAGIKAVGVLVQGVWGNGRSVINGLRLEPARGIETIQPEALDTAYKNEIVVTAKPVTPFILQVAEVRGFAGLIAPSMDASLMDRVKALALPVMLTEGFGDARMNPAIMSLLQEFDGMQATLDAYLPRRFEPRRPELVINRRVGADEEVPPLETGIALRRGMRVRVTRAPYTGQIGKVLELPDQPILLPNGLRVVCASVDIGEAEPVDIPLANLEFAGR